MKLRSSLLMVVALAAAGCQQTTGSHTARLIGTHDLVLVNDNDNPGFLATKQLNADGTFDVFNGMPSRLLYVTSADTNELRILENFPKGGGPRTFSAAPNPLETLSIPVLDRPTMLAVDEGRDAIGSRVTGNYVYAARPGGAEVSVVSVLQRRQLNGKPYAAPAPVTAIGAFMDVDRTQPVSATLLPPKTHLYLATWDGDSAAVYSAQLDTMLPTPDPESLAFTREVQLGQTPITAMLVVAPMSTRTLDGVPFCAVKECLAISLRVNSGTGGKAFMVDPATGQQASLAFGGPVRKLVSSSNGGRIYGVLDEQACGGPACGGIVAVDVVAAVTPTAPPLEPVFPASRDATGAPMPPLRTGDGLITGLTVGSYHQNPDGTQASGQILMRSELALPDGGPSGALDPTGVLQDFVELGAFASSSGTITFFSGLAGSIIDYDPRRSTVTSASVRLPGITADGGMAFINDDGGVLGSNVSLTVEQESPIEATNRVSEIVTPVADVKWRFDISDGYLQTQTIAFIYQGLIPGLVALPTNSTQGTRLFTGGSEARAAVGDIVTFESGSDATGFVECGRTTLTAIGAGFIDVSEVPASCDSRVRFSVKADGTKKLVVAADLEGYLGRFAPGDTLTYNRPYLLLPAGVIAARTALEVTIPPETAIPAIEGSFTAFLVTGFIAPYQISFDTIGLSSGTGGGGCSNSVTTQVVVGNMVMDRVPTFITSTSATDWRWTLMGVVPSGNSTLEVVLPAAHLGPFGSEGAAYCRR